MILLDTNVLSELMRPTPNTAVIDWMDKPPAASLFISAVTRAEIETGLGLLPDGKKKKLLAAAAKELFNEFQGRCLPFDEGAATRYAAIVVDCIQKGRPISVEDAQIAAIALARGLTLATRNIGDFAAISGLEVINPWGGS